MAGPLTLDASVFVSACNSREPGFADCRLLLEGLRCNDVPLIEPTILPVEVAGALRRACGDAATAQEYVKAILQLSHLTLVPLDESLMRRATQVTIQCALRGADAVYLATANRYGATLVTLDHEQQTRAPKAVHVCRPKDAMRLISGR